VNEEEEKERERGKVKSGKTKKVMKRS